VALPPLELSDTLEGDPGTAGGGGGGRPKRNFRRPMTAGGGGSAGKMERAQRQQPERRSSLVRQPVLLSSPPGLVSPEPFLGLPFGEEGVVQQQGKTDRQGDRGEEAEARKRHRRGQGMHRHGTSAKGSRAGSVTSAVSVAGGRRVTVTSARGRRSEHCPLPRRPKTGQSHARDRRLGSASSMRRLEVPLRPVTGTERERERAGCMMEGLPPIPLTTARPYSGSHDDLRIEPGWLEGSLTDRQAPPGIVWNDQRLNAAASRVACRS